MYVAWKPVSLGEGYKEMFILMPMWYTCSGNSFMFIPMPI